MKLLNKVRDSFFQLRGNSNRANSITNNFHTKNILNADNVIYRGERIISPYELENLYLNNPWVKKCITLTVKEVFKSGAKLNLEGSYKEQEDDFWKFFRSEYEETVKKAFFEMLLYGGALIVKRDEMQDPLGEYELSEDTELFNIPYTQYFGIPNYIEGTAIIDGASQWTIGTAGQVSPSFAVSFAGDHPPYSRQQYYKYQGIGTIESNLDLIKLTDVIMSSLANSTFRNGIITMKINKLRDSINSGSREKATQFFSSLELINKGLNSTAMIQIDKDDDASAINLNVAQYEKVLELSLKTLIGAFGFSATKLMGSSPDGMNATGESDIYMNIETIEEYQEQVKPQMEEIIEIALFKFFGEEVAFNLEYNSLRVMSPIDEVNYDKQAIENSINLQDVDSEEGLMYLLDKNVITPEQYDEQKKRINELNEIDTPQEGEEDENDQGRKAS